MTFRILPSNPDTGTGDVGEAADDTYDNCDNATDNGAHNGYQECPE